MYLLETIINNNHHSTIREEEDEDSPEEIDPEKDNTGAFSIMTDKQIQSGLKKLRENKLKLLQKTDSHNTADKLVGLILLYLCF